MKSSVVILALASLSLVGCASSGIKPAQRVAQTATTAPAPRPAPPKQDLTSPLLYGMLIGEVAGQRNQPALAAHAYLELARTTQDYRIAQRAAEFALQAREPDKALEAARLWLDLEPTSPTARQTVAILLVNLGKLEDARPYLLQLLASDPSTAPTAFLQLNSIFAKQTNKRQVLQLVQSLADAYPNLPEAHLAVSQAALIANEPQLSQREADIALQLRPGWEPPAILKGLNAQRLSPDAARAYYEPYLQANPKARDVRLNYARFLVRERNYAEANRQFKILLEQFPDNYDVTLAVGLLSLQLKDYAAAEAYLKRAMPLAKDPDVVKLYLGQLEEERGRFDQAKQWYASVDAGEQYLPAQIRYAGVLVKQNDLVGARKYLRALPAAYPAQKVQLWLAEAQVLRDAKAYKESFNLLGDALKQMPNNIDLLYEQAMSAEKLNRLDVMEKNLRKVIKLKPDYAHAYNALGYTLADRTTRYAEARALIDKALALSPDDPFIVDSLGWVQFKSGQTQEAVATLRRAYEIKQDPEIAAHLGEVLIAQGQREEAERVIQTALKDNPDQESLLNVAKKLRR